LVLEQRTQTADMNKFAIIVALVFTASPAAAQSATPNGQARSSTQSGATESAQAPITGVFCIEEMTGDFLQRRHRPEHRRLWRKKRSGSTGSTGSTGGSTSGLSTGPGGGTSSIPSCPAEPPFNELCN
jgi:uncharacterized membrane protein YgcG